MKPQASCDPLEEARAAKDRLLELVADFPFQSLLDKSVWLAGVLTVLARALCMPAPFFLVCGPPGSGKGILCDLVGMLVSGWRAPRLRQSTGNADQRLQVIHAARRDAALVVVDNLSRPLGNAKLDEALTATEWRVRLVGSDKVAALPLKTVWWGTSTAPRFDPKYDTERRTLIIQLAGATRDFSVRSFGPSPIDLVAANRHSLAADALTIVECWKQHQASVPNASASPWGSYERWCELVRGALVWLDLPDPVGARLDNRERHRVPRVLLEPGQHPPGLD